jgi:hypothetical protein
VIVRAETVFGTDIALLHHRGQSTGRLSVDVDVDPAVDQPMIRVPDFIRRKKVRFYA